MKREHAKPGLGPTAWTTFDGKQMPWKEWKVPSGIETKTVVIAIHGLSGAASDFWLLGERLPPQGIAVYGYELRGQGTDPDTVRRGDIDSAVVVAIALAEPAVDRPCEVTAAVGPIRRHGAAGRAGHRSRRAAVGKDHEGRRIDGHVEHDGQEVRIGGGSLRHAILGQR